MRQSVSALKFIFLGLIFGVTTGFVCQPQFSGMHEARGVWVSRWEYTIHLPENNAHAQQQKILEIMQHAREARLNFVLFQVRGQCDAYYCSNLEPWSADLTGTLGQDPGWDPLQFAIDAAHRHGLELHAWMNTFTCWKGKTPPPVTNPKHVYLTHPEWACADKNGKRMGLNDHYIFMSPGIPAVREHVQKVALDIVRRYEIDGIHFDYIRYPENADKIGYSRDPVSFQQFQSDGGNPQQLTWDDWQREQISLFLHEFNQAAMQIKPRLKISAAVLGQAGFSPTSSYATVYQDARRWLADQSIDFLVPMLYWERNHQTHAFGNLLREWLYANSSNRYIFSGLAAYKYNRPDWPTNEIAEQISLSRRMGANGVVFFSYSGMQELMKLRLFQFQSSANFPPMPWKDPVPPLAPTALKAVDVTHKSVTLSWAAPSSSLDGDEVKAYNIYRSDSPVFQDMGQNFLYSVTPNATPKFIDTEVEAGRIYYYTVSALDPANNSSMLATPIAVEIPVQMTCQRGN